LITVTCVKWGNKYSAEYVNRLEVMVRKYLNAEHRFVCLTEDPTDVKCETIALPKDNDLEGWWNKMYLFSSDYLKDTCLYFDLDTVIQQPIDCLLDYQDKLTGVYTYWNDFYTDGDYPFAMLKYKTPFNSSVMVWKAEEYYWVYDKFNDDRDWHVIKYYGDDKFLGNEIADKRTFPKGWIYSRLYGRYEHDFPTEILQIYSGYEEGLFHYPDHKICLFNGPTVDLHYKGFEHYWNTAS